jgi:hypothetical protein
MILGFFWARPVRGTIKLAEKTTQNASFGLVIWSVVGKQSHFVGPAWTRYVTQLSISQIFFGIGSLYPWTG